MTDNLFPYKSASYLSSVGVTDPLAFRGGQIGAIVALGECCLDVLDMVGDALRRPQQLACLLNLLLQRRQRRNRQAGQVLRLIDQRLRLVIDLPNLLVDRLEASRAGQHILRILTRIVDDAADLRARRKCRADTPEHHNGKPTRPQSSEES